jgi:insulin receptor
VVEGSVAILLMDEINERDVANITFPELIEITGYLMLYRIGGFTSLNQLFPNLAVIRGKEVFKDYSLVIYEMLDLVDIGLKNLMAIERGNVRIEKNELMCFSRSINWKHIIRQYEEPYIEKNKLPAHCPNCPHDKCHRSMDGKTAFCWNIDNCQRACSSLCKHPNGEFAYCSPNETTCCDQSCVGGCENGHPTKCLACKHFAMGSYPSITCYPQCPNGTFTVSPFL